MQTRSKRRRCVIDPSSASLSSLPSSSSSSSSSPSSASSGSPSQMTALGFSLRILDIPKNVVSWACTFLPASSVCAMAMTCRYLQSVAIMRSSCPVLVESIGLSRDPKEIPLTIVRWQPRSVILTNHTMSELHNLSSLQRAKLSLHRSDDTIFRLGRLSNLTCLEVEEGHHIQEWQLPCSLLELTIQWDLFSSRPGPDRFDELSGLTNLRRFSAPATRVKERHFLDLSACCATLEYLDLGELRTFESLLRDPRAVVASSVSAAATATSAETVPCYVSLSSSSSYSSSSPSSSLSWSSASSYRSGPIRFASLTELNICDISVADEQSARRLVAHLAAIPTLRKVYKFSLRALGNDAVINCIRNWCRVQPLSVFGLNLGGDTSASATVMSHLWSDWSVPTLTRLVLWCSYCDRASMMDLRILSPLAKSLLQLEMNGHLRWLCNKDRHVFDALESLTVPDNCRLIHTDSTFENTFPALRSLSGCAIYNVTYGPMRIFPGRLQSLSVCAEREDLRPSSHALRGLKASVLKSLTSILRFQIVSWGDTSHAILKPYRTLIDCIMRYRQLNPSLVGSKQLRVREERQWEAVFPRPLPRELHAILP